MKKGTPCGRVAFNAWSESKKNWGTVRSSGMKGAASEETSSDIYTGANTGSGDKRAELVG